MAIKNDIYGALKGFTSRHHYKHEYTNVGSNKVCKFFHKGREIHFELVPTGYNRFHYPLDKAEIEILEQLPTHRICLGRFKTRKDAQRKLTEILTA